MGGTGWETELTVDWWAEARADVFFPFLFWNTVDIRIDTGLFFYFAFCYSFVRCWYNPDCWLSTNAINLPPEFRGSKSWHCRFKAFTTSEKDYAPRPKRLWDTSLSLSWEFAFLRRLCPIITGLSPGLYDYFLIWHQMSDVNRLVLVQYV